MNVSRFGQACEEYQMGLTVMLRAARSELISRGKTRNPGILNSPGFRRTLDFH